MLLDTEDGKRRADQIRVGDQLWSRSEFDPNGPIELKEVQEVFVRVSPILNLHVAGQIIRTTREHPFYVEGRGWVPAAHLAMGDLLGTRDGRVVPVEGVAESGQVETVYNWRVKEYHTYFVSATQDAISIWAHNAYRTPNRTTEWSVAGADKRASHSKFGTFSRSPVDGTWWSRDLTGHGGSAWKVFRQTNKGLQWVADADRFGNYIQGKHKSTTGMFIPWGQLKVQ